MHVCLVMGRGHAMNLTAALHLVKALRVDDSRNSARKHRILIAVLAQIPTVSQQRLKAVLGEWIAPAIADSPPIE